MTNLLDARELIHKLSKVIHRDNMTNVNNIIAEDYILKMMEEKNQEMKTRILIVESKLSRLETEISKYKEGAQPTKRIGWNHACAYFIVGLEKLKYLLAAMRYNWNNPLSQILVFIFYRFRKGQLSFEISVALTINGAI